VPVFAICRGVQVLNVAAGGSLVQDIPSAVTASLNHTVDVPKDHRAHPVRVTPGTRLADSLGANVDLETCPVNSRHHQSVGRVAPAFITAAVSPDGVVEAIEKPVPRSASACSGIRKTSGERASSIRCSGRSWRRPRSAVRTREHGERLDMGRIREQVEGAQRRQGIARIDEPPRVPRQRRRIA
jgi:hypothetical protein